MKELDRIYKKIKNENDDFEQNVENGDIYIADYIILDKRLSSKEMIYLASYYCNNKNLELTDETSNLSNIKLKQVKKHLYELGYLKNKKIDVEKLKEETIKKSHKGKKCEWCQKECYILHEHHFPIPFKEGGEEVVKICPNCHYTYHLLESKKYE